MMPRVLVVEDIPESRSTYAIALQLDGHSVDEAGSKEEALGLLHCRSYHAALVDIRLEAGDESNVDGLEVVREIHRRAEGTVAVILSGHGTMGSAIEAYERYRLFRFLQKEKDKEASVDEIRKAVRGAVDRARLEPYGKFGSLGAVLTGGGQGQIAWENGCLRLLDPGGMDGLNKGLQDLFDAYVPVLPRVDERTTQWDEVDRAVRISVWSKAQGKAIVGVLQRRPADGGGTGRAKRVRKIVIGSVRDDPESGRDDFINSIWS